jgi:holliday junction DNA helicase RuvA
MIHRLQGVLIEKHPPWLFIQAGYLVYELQASMQTIAQLPDLNHELILFTHFLVREDGHFLFGFKERLERDVFRALIKVNGIGPKIALVILSSIQAPMLVESVMTHNTAALERLPGIGKKTAQRLILDMRDRLAHLTVSPGAISNHAQLDAISALVALGYSPQQAKRSVDSVAQADLNVEALIKLALAQRVNS